MHKALSGGRRQTLKRTWALGLGIILLAIIVVGYNIHLQKKIILQEAHMNTSNLVSSVELDLERITAELDQTLTRLAKHLTSLTKQGKIDPPSIRNYIDNLILENPDITGLSVVDSSGQILYWENSAQKLNVSQRQYFQVHQSRQFKGLYIGLPKQSLINEEQWIFGNSKAVYNTDKSLFLVLSAIIDVNHLHRKYQPMVTSPGSRLTITSPTGHIYTSIPDHEKFVGQRLQDFDMRRASTIDNDQELSIRKKVPGQPLVVTVTRDKTAVLAPWKTIALIFTILGGTISLAIFFITYRVVLYQRRQTKRTTERRSPSTIDPLTRLFNRPHAIELAALEIKKADRSNSSFSIILLDLDHFKEVNKKYGREKGDEVLVGTTAILKKHCRETDTLSRFGGEVFLLLLPETDLRGAVSDARKICKSLEEKHYPHTSEEFNVTASFGVAQWSTEERDITEALKRANAALSAVKNCGRNNVRWLPNRADANGINDIVCWLNVNGK
jgi:diguanylate cyclase (GGDEF)-like protein